MQFIPENELLNFREDTLEVVRRDVNLDSGERVNAAVDILENWIKKQPHFVKRDYSREYLERTVIITKGLTERAKEKLDKLCTLKTLMPEFFSVSSDLKKQYEVIGNKMPSAYMPNLAKDGSRIFITNIICDYDSNEVFNFFKIVTMYCEYLRRHDYCSGYHLILDYRHGNIMNGLVHINPVVLKEIATIVFEGYSFRIKGLYVVTPSKAVSLLVSLFKQVLSPKLASRLHVIEEIDTLYKHVPQEVMPAEYGGKEKPLKDICNKWMQVITSEESMEYYSEMCKAATIESCRPANTFNEQYVGMSGSFRALSVD